MKILRDLFLETRFNLIIHSRKLLIGKYALILSLIIFVCGCNPVIYMDVGQSPDGTVTVAGTQAEKAVLLVCDRNGYELDCKSKRPEEAASQ